MNSIYNENVSPCLLSCVKSVKCLPKKKKVKYKRTHKIMMTRVKISIIIKKFCFVLASVLLKSCFRFRWFGLKNILLTMAQWLTVTKTKGISHIHNNTNRKNKRKNFNNNELVNKLSGNCRRLFVATFFVVCSKNFRP